MSTVAEIVCLVECCAEAGSKLGKAQQLAMKIMDEAKLLRLCGE